VDCGIRDIKEVEEAKKLGMDVIITDHHEVPNKIPKAYAVVNPKQKDCHCPFKKLAGVGVAFKLAQGLLQGDPSISQRVNKNNEAFLKWLLDLVAIGTIGDCMPILGENRIFVKFGLIVLKKTKRLGILELKKIIKTRHSQDLAFYLAPRLNAAGRMDHASWAFKLLTTESKIEAFKLINKIEALNKKRQEETARVLEEARGELEYLDSKQKIIILAKENWPSALSGIVAGRLAEEYNRPALVIEKRGETSKGSARSFNNFDITRALEKIKNLFEKVGGHKEAAGFIYKTKNHDQIFVKLSGIANKEFKGDFKNQILVDLELKPEELSHKFYSTTRALAPFGDSNPEPIFLMKDLKVLEKRLVGFNNHLKLLLSKDNKKFQVIAFRKGELNDSIEIGDYIDIVFKLGEDSYLGVTTIQIEVSDLKPSKDHSTKIKEMV